ncbi:hypothetical protein K0U83_18760 [bacterium]|nr:hypothetical protein [bacterium]
MDCAHGSYNELWANPTVDVIYIGSPRNKHYRMTPAALERRQARPV